MEEEQVADASLHQNIRLHPTTLQAFPTYTAPSTLSPSFKVDEGYSDDTRSQSDKEPVTENAMALPDWALLQRESDRAGKCCLHVKREPPTSPPPPKPSFEIPARSHAAPQPQNLHTVSCDRFQLPRLLES